MSTFAKTLQNLFRAVEQHGQVSPLLDVRDPATGSTPIMYATIENKISLIEKMISLGSPINNLNKVRRQNWKGNRTENI